MYMHVQYRDYMYMKLVRKSSGFGLSCREHATITVIVNDPSIVTGGRILPMGKLPGHFETISYTSPTTVS